MTDLCEQLRPKDYERAAKAIFPLAEPKERAIKGLRGFDADGNFEFKTLTRDSTGKFTDKELAAILYDAIESPAGEFRARGSPGGTGILFNNGRAVTHSSFP